ncbi:hypothetical protein ACSBR2_004150 [Camellia fascicularis]
MFYEYATIMEILSEKQLNTLDNYYKSWNTSDGKSIQSIHPLTKLLVLTPSTTSSSSNPLTITAYVKPITNQESIKVSYLNSQLNTRYNPKPLLEIKDYKLKSLKPNKEFMETIVNKIKNINIIYNIVFRICKIQSIKLIIQKKTNRTAFARPSRYYYQRPTPQDILYEEDFLYSLKPYHGKSIYEWNIDGKCEYQIFETIHQMLMYNPVCKQNDNTNSQIAWFIINGFTGILKGWWDNILTVSQQNEILNAVKVGTNPITQLNQSQEDAIYTLSQTNLLHFVGSGVGTTNRSRELQNLRCPSLTQFHWYKFN